MKKIFFILTSVITLILSSCSNDDIPVSLSTTFKINPANVIQPFSYEINPGDLEGVDSDNTLRVRLLVYNSEGVLVQTETQYLSSYASVMSTAINLENGNYTAVVITDVVEKDGENISWACWELSDENSLTTAKITDLGYIGGKAKILGIGSKKFSISGASEEILINPTPAGAVLCTMWRNIHTFSDVDMIVLQTNRSSDYLVMNSDGGYDVAIENDNNNYKWRTNYIEPSDYPNSTNIYGYCFTLPTNNISFRYRIDTSDSESVYSDAMSFNIKAGSEYYFEIDLCDPDHNNGISFGSFEVGENRSVTGKSVEKLFDGTEAQPFLNNYVKLNTLIQ